MNFSLFKYKWFIIILLFVLVVFVAFFLFLNPFYNPFYLKKDSSLPEEQILKKFAERYPGIENSLEGEHLFPKEWQVHKEGMATFVKTKSGEEFVFIEGVVDKVSYLGENGLLKVKGENGFQGDIKLDAKTKFCLFEFGDDISSISRQDINSSSFMSLLEFNKKVFISGVRLTGKDNYVCTEVCLVPTRGFLYLKHE